MKIRQDGSGGDSSLRSCLLSVADADAIFCWGIKEGKWKWVNRSRTLKTPSSNKLFPSISSCIYSHLNTLFFGKHRDDEQTNLSRGGQEIDSGQKHPATTCLLTLVHLQELDYSATGCLCKHTHIKSQFTGWVATALCSTPKAARKMISYVTEKSS